MEKLNNKGKLVVGSLLVGTLLGATIGVLFAPHKGKKTRKNIANSVKNTANKIKKEIKKEIKKDSQYIMDKSMKFENLLEDKMSSAANSFKDKANELIANGSDHTINKK